MRAVFKRELRAYFTSPLGYVILGIMLFFLGNGFSMLISSDYGNISYLFYYVNTYTMLIPPLITMRLFSEERRQKSDQLLFTAPVSITKIVLGKYLAAFALFSICFAITLVFEIIFAALTEVNILMYISSLIGTALLGLSLLAIGTFISSITESQIIAAILGIISSLGIMMLDFIGNLFSGSFLTTLLAYLSFTTRYNTFNSGIIDFSNIIFFLSVSALFIFLTIRVHEKKRWA